jgi:ubiquinone/menaquinone biosynthesis C-methylase UbiE
MMGRVNIFTKKLTRQRLDKFIKKHASKNNTLEVGCGSSPYVNYFPNRIGLDIRKTTNVNIVGDAHFLPFKDENFDVILCTEVLEHLKDPKKAINEMKRILKSGGKLILTARFIFPVHGALNDYSRLTKSGLFYLLNDWKIEEIVEESNIFESISILLQRIAFQTDSNKIVKGLLLFIAYFLPYFNFLLGDEYRDLNRQKKEKILTSGYYVVAEKLLET